MNNGASVTLSETFACRIIGLARFMRKQHHEYELASQVIRCGTSIGANAWEAEYAFSKREFLSKNFIALKEAAETQYWIRVFFRKRFITEAMYQSLNEDCEAIIKVLTAICHSTRRSLGIKGAWEK